MKKIFVLSLVALLCLGVFAGCTPSDQTADTTQQSEADISKEADSDVDQTEPETTDEDQTQTEPEVEKEAQSPEETEKTQSKSENQAEPEGTSKDKETNEQEKLDPTTLTIDKYVQHLVSSTLGDTTSQGNEVLLDYNYSDEKLVLNLAADGNESYTVDVIQEKLFAASNKLFSKAFNDRKDIDNFTLVWYLYLVDKKDNEQGGKACTIEMTRDTFESTNWEQVSTEEFSEKVDDFWIHPALN